MHLDLKPQNILLIGVNEFVLNWTQNQKIDPLLLTPLLCDFGLSKTVDKTKETQIQGISYQYVGPEYYAN